MNNNSHRHIDRAFWLASTSRPSSRYQALTPATTKLPVRKDAITMCIKRQGNEGLKMASYQEVTINTPSRNSVPAGVCIQLLAESIQNVEISVPTATMIAANR